ncbi:MAG: ABC-2 family transporter protein [Thermomicrobiales bacterium]
MTMSQKWRVIRRLFAINCASTMAYRFEFIIWMAGSIVTPIVGLAIWRATAASGATLPVSATYLTTYFVMSSLFALATSSWHGEWMPSMIREGKLSIWLMRPGSVYFEIIANNLAEKVIKLVVLLPMVGIFGWFFRDDLAVPGGVLRWTLTIISLLLGAIMFFSLRALVGTIGFWMEETRSINVAIGLLEGILLGGIIPLALFPEWSQGFVAAQVFRFRFAFSLDVLLADLSTAELIQGFAWQLAWTAGMVAASVWLWNRGRAVFSAVGG